MDGYVTEHVGVIRSKSKLYAHLSNLESSIARKYAMASKRKDLIKELYKEISPKHFVNIWRELCIEYGEICLHLFELRRNELFSDNNNAGFDPKKKGFKKKLIQMNENGIEGLKVYEEIYVFFNSDDYKSDSLNDDYIQSVVNAKFNIAKISSGVIIENKEERIEYLKKSLDNYQFIIDFIRQKGKEKGNLAFNFSEQLRMCEEMVELLPVKIGKLASG